MLQRIESDCIFRYCHRYCNPLQCEYTSAERPLMGDQETVGERRIRMCGVVAAKC